MAEKSTGLSHEYIIHPGETLRELLDDRDMSQSDLSKRAGVTPKHISEVINGRASISPKLASALENVFAVPAIFWLNLQNNYDLECIQANTLSTVTEDELLILKQMKNAITYMRDCGFLDPRIKGEGLVVALRRFLAVNNLTAIPSLAFNAAFRKGNTAVDPYTLFAWVKICEALASNEPTSKPLDVDKLEELIPQIKALMLEDINTALPQLKELFADCGINFGVVKHITGAPVQGFIERTHDDEMILYMTIRGAFADRFWFTLFHEIAHIINEDVPESGRFLDYYITKNDAEDTANAYARDILLSPSDFSEFVQHSDFSIASIQGFANKQRVFPGIVIGRLRNEGRIPHSWHTEYMLRYKWK